MLIKPEIWKIFCFIWRKTHSFLIGFCLIAIFVQFLTGCTSITTNQQTASLAPAPSWQSRALLLSRLQNWQISGKIAVQTAHESGSATVDWQKNNGQYFISLFGPLGAHRITLRGQPGFVILETPDGKRATATNAEQLLLQQAGWRLPVSYLNYWIRGLPVPNLAAREQFDAQNRLRVLIQKDWSVQFLSYTTISNIDLPERLAISSTAFKTKIIIYKWRIDH